MTAVLTAAVIDVFCAGPKFTKTETDSTQQCERHAGNIYSESDLIVISSSSTFMFTTKDIRTLGQLKSTFQSSHII